MRLTGVAGGLACLVLAGCNLRNSVLDETPYGPFGEMKGDPAFVLSDDPDTRLPKGEMALRKIDPSQYPDFSPGYAEREGLSRAIDQSLAYLAKPSSRRFFPYLDIGHDRAVRSLRRFRELLASVSSGRELNDEIVREFDVYESKGARGKGRVRYTAYYEPILEARRVSDGIFRHPLYRQPEDLVSDAVTGDIRGRRTAGGGIDPSYPTRAELEDSGVLKGLELFYLNDPFDVYVVQVQGSAQLRLADGNMVRIGHAGNNGREYTPIRNVMVEDGRIPATSRLREMRAYFREHPEDVAHYTRLNDRFIFFTERTDGPVGSINALLTPMRSIATDKSVFPRACLAYVITQLPQLGDESEMTGTVPFASFALDQDTGGAIRAAGRCDIFIGTGSAAGELAGFVYQPGRLYYIFLKQ